VISLATLLLFIGATGKSAQIPLYVWLPDAMEGPTPVSALIHAATMVTAGVYMIGRNAELFSHAPVTLLIVGIIGAATALMAGTIGLVQNDIKRVLAYSTVSQLGYMFLAMGMGAYSAGIFHLYTHAFFKALLFLGSGAVIHALAGEQDIRNMGGLKKDLPITYWTFLIGAIAISGVPFLSGFFSKDEILWKTFAAGHWILWTIGILTSLLTATYMFRLVFLTFHGERRSHAAGHGHSPSPAASSQPGAHGSPSHASAAHHAHDHLHDAPPAMAIPLIVLAIGSIVAGYVGVPAALGGSNAIEHYLHPSFVAHGTMHEGPAAGEHAAEATEASSPVQIGEPPAEHSPREFQLMAVSSAIALIGIGLAWFLFLKNPSTSEAIARSAAPVHRLLMNKYYVDELYDSAVVHPIQAASERVLWKVVDVDVIDGAVNGAGTFVSGTSSLLRRLQSGSVRGYAVSLLVGVVAILAYYLWLVVAVAGNGAGR
jgi:NADH-quinone oxidoreductase subunit L